MKTEYLIPINTQNGIAKTEEAFNHLLMSNANLQIDRNKIKFENLTFTYKLQSKKIEKSDFVCYHITIENNIEKNDFDPNAQCVKTYLELLKNIRSTVLKYANTFEILWDDVSFCCSQRAYPQIYEIENLMRKLLTKFMLVNVGTKWEKENTPSKIGKSKNQDKEINIGNSLLYQLDFIELSTFLFDPYSLKGSLEDLKSFVSDKDSKIFSVLDQYIPKSNWARYFSSVISTEDEHLKKKWDELYQLRCKVAHNNLFTINDLERVESLIQEIKPHLENAINELDKISVSDSDKEIISENLAKNSNEGVGDFLEAYNTLYKVLSDKFKGEETKGIKRIPYKRLIHELLSKGDISDVEAKKLYYIMYKRNNLVHGVESVDKDDLYRMIQDIMLYITLYKDNQIEGRDNRENK